MNKWLVIASLIGTALTFKRLSDLETKTDYELQRSRSELEGFGMETRNAGFLPQRAHRLPSAMVDDTLRLTP